jgi:hypothetical protein
VIALEDLKPIPKYLVYLRPRKENQWFKFFNDAVTYAPQMEVFEDNFRVNDGATPSGSPLRYPIILVYLQVSMLDSLLG